MLNHPRSAQVVTKSVTKFQGKLGLPPGPGKGREVPVFKLEAEDGTWLSDVRLGPPDWKPGDRIPRGCDMLEVVRVRHDDERDVLVVRPVQV